MPANFLPVSSDGSPMPPPLARPLYGEHDAAEQASYYGHLTQESHLSATRKRPFILVVDDDQCIGELLAELLAEIDFRVEVACNGQEAYDVACRDVPALILTDFMMPECDGEHLAQRLRDNPETRGVPLALMSSARPRLSDLRGIPFLPKPFDIDDVLTFVHRYVAVSRPHGEG